MKATFTVTVEGSWYDGGKPVTAAIMERELREAVKNQFEFLATRATVKRTKNAAPTNAKEST